MNDNGIKAGDRVAGKYSGKQGTVRYKGKSRCFVDWDDGVERTVELDILSKLPPEPELPEGGE